MAKRCYRLNCLHGEFHTNPVSEKKFFNALKLA
jgi:hypothetical protein